MRAAGLVGGRRHVRRSTGWRTRWSSERSAQATGGRLRGAISGGGLMPAHIDRFFRTIGVPILIGYGLTETSPVVTVRREERNVLGTIGMAIPEVEIQIRDPETGRPLPAGSIGVVVHARPARHARLLPRRVAHAGR